MKKSISILGSTGSIGGEYTEDNIDKYHQINKFVYGLSREIRKEEVGKLPQDQMHNISDNLEELEDHDIPQMARYQPPAGIFKI